MKTLRFPATIAVFTVVLPGLAAACRSAAPKSAGAGGAAGGPESRPPIVQPGAPGEPSKIIGATQATDLSHVQATDADVKFMQGMIGHHQQAIEMVALVKTHAVSDDVKKLALRIDLSQEDEIKMMQTWLRQRGQQVPGRDAMHMHGATLMPGMLSPEEMQQLADAKGAAFDRLFLEGMIKHHGGALTMVKDLMDTPGAAQESEVFAFVSDVEADQTAEIGRMEAMLTMVKELER